MRHPESCAPPSIIKDMLDTFNHYMYVHQDHETSDEFSCKCLPCPLDPYANLAHDHRFHEQRPVRIYLHQHPLQSQAHVYSFPVSALQAIHAHML